MDAAFLYNVNNQKLNLVSVINVLEYMIDFHKIMYLKKFIYFIEENSLQRRRFSAKTRVQSPTPRRC